MITKKREAFGGFVGENRLWCIATDGYEAGVGAGRGGYEVNFGPE